MRGKGWGPSGTGTRRVEGGGGGGGGDGGGCFTAAVSLLLRVGILMRSVNECWQRRGCASVEKQPPCPCRTAAAPSFAIPFHSRIQTKCARLILFVPHFPFSLYLMFIY